MGISLVKTFITSSPSSVTDGIITIDEWFHRKRVIRGPDFTDLSLGSPMEEAIAIDRGSIADAMLPVPEGRLVRWGTGSNCIL
jgi:hypothetical protein